MNLSHNKYFKEVYCVEQVLNSQYQIHMFRIPVYLSSLVSADIILFRAIFLR